MGAGRKVASLDWLKSERKIETAPLWRPITFNGESVKEAPLKKAMQ